MTAAIVPYVWIETACPPKLMHPILGPPSSLGIRYLAGPRLSDISHLAPLIPEMEGIPAHAEDNCPIPNRWSIINNDCWATGMGPIQNHQRILCSLRGVSFLSYDDDVGDGRNRSSQDEGRDARRLVRPDLRSGMCQRSTWRVRIVGCDGALTIICSTRRRFVVYVTMKVQGNQCVMVRKELLRRCKDEIIQKRGGVCRTHDRLTLACLPDRWHIWL